MFRNVTVAVNGTPGRAVFGTFCETNAASLDWIVTLTGFVALPQVVLQAATHTEWVPGPTGVFGTGPTCVPASGQPPAQAGQEEKKVYDVAPDTGSQLIVPVSPCRWVGLGVIRRFCGAGGGGGATFTVTESLAHAFATFQQVMLWLYVPAVPTDNDTDPEVGKPRPKVPASPFEEQSVAFVDDQERVTVVGATTFTGPSEPFALMSAVGGGGGGMNMLTVGVLRS